MHRQDLRVALVEEGDEAHAHSVSFPDLPSVFSAADDAKDIVPNAIEALRLWAEDLPMPEPSTLAEIVSRDDVREMLATGSFYAIAIPLIDNDTAVVRAST